MCILAHTQVICFLNSQEGLVLNRFCNLVFYLPIHHGHVFVSSQISFCCLTAAGPIVWLGEEGSARPRCCTSVWLPGFPCAHRQFRPTH